MATTSLSPRRQLQPEDPLGLASSKDPRIITVAAPATSIDDREQTSGQTGSFWQQMRREWSRLYYRHLLRNFPILNQIEGFKVQMVILLVIIPSILAGIVIAQVVAR